MFCQVLDCRRRDVLKCGNSQAAAKRRNHPCLECAFRPDFHFRNRRYGSCFFRIVRAIKLTGREASVVRAIGFTESMLGAEIQDLARMELEDITDTLNGLIAAGFVESIPYAEEVQMADMPATAFELNPAYVHELRQALIRR